ncbi:MAG: hypothetical protein EPN25_00735 [Nitrospirae bacterium]|nr:MAG: hypothetical protein EPN25_00735 [Nitrospirota bacterium]
MKKRTSRKKPEQRGKCSYIIEMMSWDFAYSIGINDIKHIIEDKVFLEHKALNIKGVIIEPAKFRDREINVTVSGSREITPVLDAPENYPHAQPQALGEITLRVKQSELRCWVPFDAFQVICSMFIAGKIKYLDLYGETLFRGFGNIHSVRFERKYCPEDFG